MRFGRAGKDVLRLLIAATIGMGVGFVGVPLLQSGAPGTRAEASASASATSLIGKKPGGKEECRVAAPSSAVAESDGRRVSNHDEDRESSRDGACSATTTSKATAVIEGARPK